MKVLSPRTLRLRGEVPVRTKPGRRERNALDRFSQISYTNRVAQPLSQNEAGNPTNGAVAQLGERLNGIQEVVGSIPISSIRK